MTLRELLGRATAWMQRDRLTRELNAELDAHAELLARDFEAEGMSQRDARAAARRQLGRASAQREESRDAWGFPALDALLQDGRYALRGLARSPAFTATVIITLGLGIGANTMMFAVIDRLMFRPFPYMRDPGMVHGVYLQTTYRGVERTNATFPYTRFLDLQRGTHAFSQYAVVSEWRLAVGTGQGTRVRKVAGVSASLFEFFDAPPVLGRYFASAEDVTPLGAMVAVVGQAYWRAELGGRDVIGERLRIGTLDYTIIGVAPPGFVGTVAGGAPELFIPITTVAATVAPSSAADYFTSYNWDWTEVLVRRKPGVTVEVASADLTQAYKASRAIARARNPRTLPDSIARPRAIASAVRSANGPDAGLESRVLRWVAGVAAIVLLIACANVANLMLARILRRRREIAVRLALGVSRARLVGQFVTEGLILATLGGAAALAVAQWGGIAIRRLLLPDGSSFNLATDWRTMSLTGACAVVAALLTALGPAILATRANLTASLKAGAREGTYRSSRLRSVLLVMQGALSVVLLIGAALFVRSLRNVLDIPLGYDVSTVIDVYPDFRGLERDSATRVALNRRLLAAAQTIPGVEAAARVNSRLFGTSTTTLRVPGIDSVEALGRFNFQISTRDYFTVMGTHIVRGRAFDDRDREGSAPSVIVSDAMARALWPGQDPIGKCIQVSWRPEVRIATQPCTTVIGVAENTAQQGLLDEQRFMYYLNVDQTDPSWVSGILVRLREPANVTAKLERVRRAMQAVMPGDGFVVVRPLQELVDDQRRSWRLGATLFVAFGALALVVAAVGLYGVIGYNVAQRMHELGVRVALGAQWTDIVRLVVSQGLAFAAAGVAIGLFIAALTSHWLAPLLYKQSPRDPLAYAAIGAIMIAVACVASAVPAVKAARADPNRALRAE